ncbi:MAG: F0F1 ATP synthase subunit B [Campylobacteraceae bacterium]|nr:F0F1 ATP synthase subunit B [Campylobacteraceae bacterium]
MKKLSYLFVLFLPVLVVAADAGPKDYDFIPRTFNFILFFGILFYLLKDFVKRAYNNRINSIADRLDEIQNKLKESKDKKAQAIKDVELAKVRSLNLIDVAKKEVESIKAKRAMDLEHDIASLEKSYENKKEFESKKVTKAVVSEILTEAFSDESVKLGQKELIDIVSKKVG